jgi:CheY-like chemotaxis protein
MLQSEKYVLMLEEDPDDRFITDSMLTELNLNIKLKYLSNSDELYTELTTANKPDIIILNYDSKPEDSLSILLNIKSHNELKKIPVVILSDSDQSLYVKQCYAAGASSFIKKPVTLEQTKKKIETFFNYWLQVAEV